MSRTKKIIILINLMFIIGYVVYAITKKESLLKEGKLVLFELAPVDPRSLMQGDYMNLRYNIANEAYQNDWDNNVLLETKSPQINKRGYVVVRLDSLGVARFVRLQATTSPLGANEYCINYTLSNYQLNIGADSYFFEEGTAEKFARSKYGGIKLDNKGNSLLVGLYDSIRRPIKP